MTRVRRREKSGEGISGVWRGFCMRWMTAFDIFVSYDLQGSVLGISNKSYTILLLEVHDTLGNLIT